MAKYCKSQLYNGLFEIHFFQKPTSYINQSTDQHCRSIHQVAGLNMTRILSKGIFAQTTVLLFIDITTTKLTSTEQLVKKAKNMLTLFR